MTLISKFFRVGVEGDTIDGRVITRQMIQDAAETYNPSRYGARVWTEHFRGIIPFGLFDPLGDVFEAKAEEVTDVDELKGKLGLYVRIIPSDELVKMNRAGKKVYSSMELMPNFAKSGKFYLTGLAVTDEPASQGTEMMAFSAGGAEIFAGQSHVIELEFIHDDKATTDDTGEGKPSLFSRVKDIIGRKPKNDDERFSDIHKSVEMIAGNQQEVVEQAAATGETLKQFAKEHGDLKEAHEKLQQDFNALQEKLESTPSNQYTPRSPASGGTGDEVTDC